METYKFKSQNGKKAAITHDKTGEILPAEFAPWILSGVRNIDAEGGPRIGKDSAEIVAEIERQGFSILPDL